MPPGGAHKRDPYLVEAYAECCKVLEEIRDMNQAATIIQAGLESNPDAVVLHERASELAAQGKRRVDVLRDGDRLIAHDPDAPLPHAYAALARTAKDETCDDMALRDLDRALAIDPDLVWGHYGTAICHLEHGELQPAQDQLKFILGMRGLPPDLRVRAEQMLERLMPDEAGILRQSFEDAIQWASETRNDQLRQELEELLGEAQSVWESGDTEVARLHPRRAKQWVADNADVLKQPIPVELNAAIDRILALAAQQ